MIILKAFCTIFIIGWAPFFFKHMFFSTKLIFSKLYYECEALLTWRNTPTVMMTSSPAQRMFGRALRTPVSKLDATLERPISKEAVKINKKKMKYKDCYDHTARDLSELQTRGQNKSTNES